MGQLISFVDLLAAAGAIAGIGYNLFCIWAARRFLRSGPEPRGFTPPVSVLKPLRGADPHIYEAFRSHCLVDYPEYELLFGVQDRSDPAVPAVERLMQEFPGQRIRLVVCPQALGTNRKVSSLVQMLAVARYDHVLVSDSDVRVPHDYLRAVMGSFADSRVGMVTCLYRGILGGTLGAKLESLGIATDFAPGVLMARWLEGVKFGLGSTLALTRHILQKIGGFETLAAYLADDYELGARVAATGAEVRLARIIVEHLVPDYSLRSFWLHQRRWARGMRDSRPGGYAGLALTFAVPWALLALLLSSGAGWAWALLVTALAARFAAAGAVGWGVLRDPQVFRLGWLLPLRDLVALAVWISSFFGHTVVWRGDRFVLEKGKIKPVGESVRNGQSLRVDS